MNTRGIVVLAQNSLDYNYKILSRPVLQPQYEGVHVDIWYKELAHIKGQHIFHENIVYKVTETALPNTEFYKIKKELLVKNVKLHSDKNLNLQFNRAKKNNVVLSDNKLYTVVEEDKKIYYDFKPIYEDIFVDVWYSHLKHYKGQHVWINNTVYRLEKNLSEDARINNKNSVVILEDVKLHDDDNQSLTFKEPMAGDVVLSYNKLFAVEPIIFADYIKQACYLAASLKHFNPAENISIITNDTIPEQYQKLFDKIIPIPFGDESMNSSWKVENRWKIYHSTPYDETLVLDTDMLILQDISSWWNFFSNYDLYFTSNVLNYRGDLVTDNFYRKTFVKNYLPNIYVGMHYFKKSEKAEMFYKLLETICKNWKDFYEKFLPHETPVNLSIDVAAALAIKILDLEDDVINYKNKEITFVHMKSKVQDWNMVGETWQDSVLGYMNDSMELKIGNYSQSKIFHYTEKDFLSNSSLKKLLGEINE